MFFISDWYILPLAFLLDFLLGDPRWLPHPVRWMGRAIERFEPVFRRRFPDARRAGLLFALSLIVSTLLICGLSLLLARAVHPALGAVVEIVMIYYSISAFSLRREALGVMAALSGSGLDGAKARLAMIVGRDVEPLDEEGVRRATLETVAENFVDGVLSPLFFAGIGGAPLALTYKMINTLDSMVGYKDDTYADFGRASARIDDLANYVPARLAVPVVAAAVFLKKGNWKQAWTTAMRDGHRHSSPNAGFPEAAFAGALTVRLGGPNLYGGVLVDKPYIGDGFGPVGEDHVNAACDLLVVSSALSVFVAMTLAHLVGML
ncbi:adenosylcobinamide-phosphate synthase CbiB [Desulfatiferula olefinivorans]